MSKLENFFAGFVSYIQHLRELFYLSLAIALLQFTGCCVNQDENNYDTSTHFKFLLWW